MDEPLRNRRSLTHVGGQVDVAGDPAAARELAHALDVDPATDADDEPARTHVHGFHTYPARMHPVTAARLAIAFAPPGGRVLDPFCGSGTVLVESLLAGRVPLGRDLNPIAVRLAKCKVRPRSPGELDALTAFARHCAAQADARRKAKAGASRRFPAADVQMFEPHVLLELDSLRSAVVGVADELARRDLELVLSAILVKLSKKRGDTANGTAPRRTAAGFPAKLFVQKADDLAARLAEYSSRVPPPWPERFDIQEADATVPRSLPGGQAAAIVTSPPYAATYDYLAHHELRLRWLDLNARPLARGEIGSRSAYRRVPPQEAHREWGRELGRFLHAAGTALPRGRPLAMVMADSAVGNVAIRADEIVAEVARENGFVPIARASQPRPHFHGPTAAAFRQRPRFEHAILLERG